MAGGAGAAALVSGGGQASAFPPPSFPSSSSGRRLGGATRSLAARGARMAFRLAGRKVAARRGVAGRALIFEEHSETEDCLPPHSELRGPLSRVASHHNTTRAHRPPPRGRARVCAHLKASLQGATSQSWHREGLSKTSEQFLSAPRLGKSGSLHFFSLFAPFPLVTMPGERPQRVGSPWVSQRREEQGAEGARPGKGVVTAQPPSAALCLNSAAAPSSPHAPPHSHPSPRCRHRGRPKGRGHRPVRRGRVPQG